MFGFSLIKTAKLKHLYSEVSKLAIENVELNKEVAKREAAITELNNALDGEQSLSGILAMEIGNLNSQNKHLKHLLFSFRSLKVSKKKKH